MTHLSRILPVKTSSGAPADSDEQSALVPERAHPPELRQPALEPPVVARIGEQLVIIVSEERARIRTHVVDTGLCEPALHFTERVPVFFGMVILVAHPRSVAVVMQLSGSTEQ